MGSRRAARILAFQSLYSWELNKQSLDELLTFSWTKDKVEDENLLFSSLVIRGTIENIQEIDNKLKKNLRHWELERIRRVDLAILRISAYSLLFQKDIPSHVTINEAVEISKEYGTDESYKFVNGVLDSLLKKNK